MDDEFGALPDELVTFEERQDLSQYSYDPTDMMESVNSDVALVGESTSLPSSQDKLFDIDYCLFGESDQTSADDGLAIDVLDMLGLSALDQSLTVLENNASSVPELPVDSQAHIVGETTLSDLAADDDDRLHFDVSSPGTSSLPDSTTCFAVDTTADSEADASELAQLSDSDLLSLSTRELNRRIRNMPHDLQLRIKNRRRTLKNRGYAQTCRTRRVGQRHQLENENERLADEILQLKQDNNSLLAECERLRKAGNQFKTERDNFQSRLVGLLAVLTENGIVVQESE